MNLGIEETSKIIKIYGNFFNTKWKYCYNLFKNYIQVFGCTYKYLRGVLPEDYEHKIVLEEDVTPMRQRQYRMNSKYSLLVKKEIDKLLGVGFIYKVPFSEWVSPIVVVPKKNGKLRICQDFCKLNSITRNDYFPLPFADTMLDVIAGHKRYSFMDGFSRYNQIQIYKCTSKCKQMYHTPFVA